ncbi:hypothetical protein [Persicitalea sp.]|uniref:hypothetical protein n=1 Tax=Persicitalea sp. TaxID=3100273 RepID=UPI0035941E8E
MKSYILIVRGPENFLNFLEDRKGPGKPLSIKVRKKFTEEYQQAMLVFNEWITAQKDEGTISIYSQLSSLQIIYSGEQEIDFELLEVIEGAKVISVIYAQFKDERQASDFARNCPLPNEHYSIEVRSVDNTPFLA